MRLMRVQRFGAHVTSDSNGRAVIAVPFDPDETWGAKAFHPVGGTIQPVSRDQLRQATAREDHARRRPMGVHH